MNNYVVNFIFVIIGLCVLFLFNEYTRVRYSISFISKAINFISNILGMQHLTDPLVKFIDHPSREEIDRKFWDEYMNHIIFNESLDQKIDQDKQGEINFDSNDLKVYGYFIDDKTILTDDGELIHLKDSSNSLNTGIDYRR